MKLIKQIISAFTCFTAVLLSMQCAFAVEAQLTQAYPELQRSSVVVVTGPEFKPGAETVYFWADSHADISGALENSDMNVKKIIDEGIRKTLQDKGYSFNQSKEKNILIKYHVSLASEMDDMSLAMHYGLAPGLHANNAETRKYEKGTLVVDLINEVNNAIIWRGAIAVFTGIEDSDAARQQRVNGLMTELFSSIPPVR